MASSKKLLDNGLNEQTPITQDLKSEGMDNMGDPQGQKPVATPRKSVSEKDKSFTIR